MSFPLAHPFRTNGLYISKVDPESNYMFTKQDDGTLKPYKESMASKLFKFATTKKVDLPYDVLLVKERYTVDYSESYAGRMTNPYLEIYKAMVTGELHGIINSYKGKHTFQNIFTFNIQSSETSSISAIWQSVDRPEVIRLDLRNNGDKLILTSVDTSGKPYRTEYYFMQWES